jgi:hypothetical protein
MDVSYNAHDDVKKTNVFFLGNRETAKIFKIACERVRYGEFCGKIDFLPP